MAMRPKVNVKNTYGDTPLHVACEYGHTEAINELFKQDAEVNARNKKGMTPLMMAVQFQDKNPKKSNPLDDFRLSPVAIMIKTLLRKGADVNMVNSDGESVLHVYVKNGQTSPHFSSIMRMLLDNGVDVSVKDNKGRTALELTDMELRKLNESNNMRKAREFVEEGFQVSTVLETDLSPRELELREIQTMLFNHMIKSDSDKYKGYINVSEIPKGAPIEVLNYVCSGDNPEIQGIENKAKCESMGGVFTKVKKPTTKVKLELIPESEKEILEQKQTDLYYSKQPESIPERELPEEIKQINTMNVKGLNNIQSNNNSHIKQVDDEQYIDRDNMLPSTDYNTNTNKGLNTDNESFNSVKPKRKSKKIGSKNYNLIKETDGPPTFYSAKELSESVKDAFNNSNNLMINSKSNISKTEYLNNVLKYLGQNYLGIILIIVLIILLLKVMKTF
jgi:ankyrin repeat protein